MFLRYFRKVFSFSFLRDVVPPVGNNVPRDPLDVRLFILFPHLTQRLPSSSLLHPAYLPTLLRVVQTITLRTLVSTAEITLNTYRFISFDVRPQPLPLLPSP